MEQYQKHERCRRCGSVLLNAAMDVSCPEACGAKYHHLCWVRSRMQCRHIRRLPGAGLWIHTCVVLLIILVLVGLGSLIRRSLAAKNMPQEQPQNGGTLIIQEPCPLWDSPLRQQMARETDSLTGLNWEVVGRLTLDEYLQKYKEKTPIISLDAHRKACASYVFYRTWVNETDVASFTSARIQQVNELRDAVRQWDDSLLAYRLVQLGKSVQPILPVEELEAQREEVLGDIISSMREWMPQRERIRDPAAEEFKALDTLLITPQLADITADLIQIKKGETELTLLLKLVRKNVAQLPNGSARMVGDMLLDQYVRTQLHFVLPASVTNSVTSAVMPSGLIAPPVGQ